MAIHAACTRDSGNGEGDVTLGTIGNCDNVEVPTNMELGCVLSNDFFGVSQVYAAEGDCVVIASVCDGLIGCPDNAGDYNADITCPAGHQLVDKTIAADGLQPEVKSKVCTKICESDRDCRWNASDDYWNGPGEYRCQTTSLSNGVKICTDARNEEL